MLSAGQYLQNSFNVEVFYGSLVVKKFSVKLLEGTPVAKE